MQQGNRIILILGILAISAGICVYFEALSFQKNARLKKGTVVYVLGSSYRIQYIADDGTEKLKQGSGKNHGFREGESTNVWYRTDNPDKARLSDGKKGGKKIFIAGAFCILLGIYPSFKRRQKAPGTIQ